MCTLGVWTPIIISEFVLFLYIQDLNTFVLYKQQINSHCVTESLVKLLLQLKFNNKEKGFDTIVRKGFKNKK